MCILSHIDIQRELVQGRLGIEPYNYAQIKPNGYDWRLGGTILTAIKDKPNEWHTTHIAKGIAFMFQPGEFYLCTTIERLSLPLHIMATMTGRSSVGRLGVTVHKTAAHFDAGFTGCGTAELEVEGPWPIPLMIGQRVGQFLFEYLRTPAALGYDNWEGSKYAHQPNVPVISRLYKDEYEVLP